MALRKGLGKVAAVGITIGLIWTALRASIRMGKDTEVVVMTRDRLAGEKEQR